VIALLSILSSGPLVGLAAVGAYAGTAVAAAHTGLKIAHKEIKYRGGERFLNRKNRGWYTRIENSLFDYIRGNVTN